MSRATPTSLNRLRWEEVATLPIFNCVVCNERLQCPVMQVATWGNICGRCYDRGVYTDARENVDVHILLSFLSIPCNYAKYGCNVEDSFENTCAHERHCYYRHRMCPFVYQGDCEECSVPDLINHIRTSHADSVLVARDNTVVINNPLSPYRTIFYLLDFNAKQYLLRIKGEYKRFLYLLYYFDYNNGTNTLDELPFSMAVEQPNLSVRYRSLYMFHESQITHVFNIVDALKVPDGTLKNMDCMETMSVSFDFEVKPVEVDKRLLSSFSCWYCLNYCTINTHICRACGPPVKLCNNCFYYKLEGRCPCCDSKNFSNISLRRWCVNFEFPCINEGCPERFWGENYVFHEPQCGFKHIKCPFGPITGCRREALYTQLARHLTDEHAELLSDDLITADVKMITEADFIPTCFIRNNDTIRVDYRCTFPGSLVLSVGILGPVVVPYRYIWKVVVGKSNLKTYFKRSLVHWGDSDPSYIDVTPFVVDRKIDFTIFFDRVA